MDNNQSPSRCQKFRNVMASLPIFFKYISVCTIITGIYSLFFRYHLPRIFANYPFYSLFYIQLWRLFTSFLVTQNLITAVYSLYVLWFIFPLIERNLSTIVVIFDVIANNFVIQVLYNIIWFSVFYFDTQRVKQLGQMGTWGVWMVFLTRVCESDPYGKIKFCGLFFTVKKRIYPLIMIVIYSTITFQIPLQLVLGYLMGLYQCKYKNGTLIRLTSQQYQRCFYNRYDFVRFSQANYAKQFSRQSHNTYVQFYGLVVGKIVSGDYQAQQKQKQQNQNAADISTISLENEKEVTVDQIKLQQISQSISTQHPLNLTAIKQNGNPTPGYAILQEQK